MNAPVPKILLVDDDELVRMLYGRQLEQVGYQVVCAGTGKEALDITFLDHPQAIILDIDMPEMDGFSALRELQDQAATRAIPVIIITSVADYRLCREAAKAHGATAFLTKPFGPKQLLTEVQKALQGSAEVA